MTMFSVRVADDLAARFDAVAAGDGGRSAVLRRLIVTVAANASAGGQAQHGPRTAARVMVRLAEPDATGLDREAAAMGLSRAGWVAALVRRRVRERPTFGRADELALIAIQAELRRIGINIDRIARVLNAEVLDGRALDLEIAFVRDLRAELRGHLRDLRGRLDGNLSYWQIDP